MNLLAIDTSMQACSVAVLVTGGSGTAPEICSVYEPISRGHAERLMPMIDEVLNSAKLTIGELDRLAVTTGPGTFTGVRIGIATVRGLALALDLDIVAINTLRVIAADCFANGPLAPDQLLGVAIDARRDQIYFQLFNGQGPADQNGPQALHLDQIIPLLPADKTVLLTGSGSELLQSALARQSERKTALLDFRGGTPLPRAKMLARLASVAPVCKTAPEPLYLRPPDAKIQSGYAIERQ